MADPDRDAASPQPVGSRLEEDGYSGPAQLAVGGETFDVRAELRGHFQPIDGRYHWHGRIAAHGGLARALSAGRTDGVLATPAGAAPCELSEPDPWGRYRVTGFSTPPFAAAAASAPPHEGGEAPLPRHVRVAIIGAGFSGLGAGARLLQAGRTDFVILERADAVGGTWRDNSYPGCACDVPSHLYSFSFAPNPDWSHSFSRQAEIWRYLEAVARRRGLAEHIRFGAEVREARWDGARARWQVRTSLGDLTADVLISGAGPLSDPAIPAIEGIAGFPGGIFHSARWDHGCDLAGKRVAVIGTGASAIQLAPRVARTAAHLVLFQRTPAWILPRRDRRITAAEKWLYRRVPLAQRAARLSIYAAREASVVAFTRRPRLLRRAQRLALRHLNASIPDPALRAKLTPGYVMGCKRILLSNDFYPALTRPNVELVNSGLARVDGATLIAQDGTAREVDAVIFATGFHAVDPPIARQVYRADGASLAEAWRDGMRALRGTTVPGFPNFCLLIGPNTGLGHSSMIHVIESQLNYILDYLAVLDASGAAALDVRPAALEAWCADIERRTAPTVWATGGCVSWYLNPSGHNTALWPGSTIRFRRETRRVDPAEYELIPAPPDRSPAAPAAAGAAGEAGRPGQSMSPAGRPA